MTQAQIIRSQADIPAAPTAVLVATYNALTGKDIKKFENRAIAEVRVANAILAAENAAGHLGVAKGQRATAMTAEEVAAHPNGKVNGATHEMATGATNGGAPVGLDASAPTDGADGQGGADAELDEHSFPVNSLAHQLIVATKSLKPIEPRAKAAPQRDPSAAPRRAKFEAVRATMNGHTKPQAGSNRNAVLLAIQGAPDRTITIAALEQLTGWNVRGYVQKLIEGGHVEAVSTGGQE